MISYKEIKTKHRLKKRRVENSLKNILMNNKCAYTY